MQIRRCIIFLFIAFVFPIRCLPQDTPYAIKIDSLWLHSYDTKLLSRKREKLDNTKVEYSFYKNSKNIRSILILDKDEKQNLLFFFLEGKLVMLSPSGQQPYLVLNDKVVSGKEMKHTPKEFQVLIAKAYAFLERGYKKIKGASD